MIVEVDPVCVIKVPGLDSSSHPSVVLLTVGRRAPEFVALYLHWEQVNLTWGEAQLRFPYVCLKKSKEKIVSRQKLKVFLLHSQKYVCDLCDPDAPLPA